MLLKIYIILCGLVLVSAGALGFSSEFALTLETAVFGQYWYSDTNQNLFHIALGFFIFFIGVGAGRAQQKISAWLFSLVSMGLAIYSLNSDTLFSFFGLEKPGDTAFYLVLGSFGLLILTISYVFERSGELEELRYKLKTQ